MKDFLKKLIDDPKFQEEFARDPEGVMARENVPEDAREAIRKGDLEALARAAGIWPDDKALAAPWPPPTP